MAVSHLASKPLDGTASLEPFQARKEGFQGCSPEARTLGKWSDWKSSLLLLACSRQKSQGARAPAVLGQCKGSRQERSCKGPEEPWQGLSAAKAKIPASPPWGEKSLPPFSCRPSSMCMSSMEERDWRVLKSGHA